ncbi:MAG: glycosyltransferase [archaeon]
MISVIVPAFNSEKTIAETISSILSQKTKKEFELIVVDDASTDSTLKKISEFDKVKLIKLEKNSGPAVARNAGAKKARGEIIVFTDSDCVAEKNWLEEMIKPFEDTKVVGVQGAYKTKQNSLTARFVQAEIEDRYDLMKKSMQKNGSIDFIGSYSAAYRKKTFLEFNGFNESFPIASGEDPELSYRMEKKGLKLEFNPKAVVWHVHPESFLKYIKVKFFRGYWRVLMYKEHKDKMLKDSYTPQALKFQIILLYAIITGLILTALNKLIQFNPLISNSVNSALSLFIITAAALFILSIIPFTLKALKKDVAAGILVPAFVFFRTIAFCSGLITGILKVKK